MQTILAMLGSSLDLPWTFFGPSLDLLWIVFGMVFGFRDVSGDGLG